MKLRTGPRLTQGWSQMMSYKKDLSVWNESRVNVDVQQPLLLFDMVKNKASLNLLKQTPCLINGAVH